jgi:hypothetical protein
VAGSCSWGWRRTRTYLIWVCDRGEECRVRGGGRKDVIVFVTGKNRDRVRETWAAGQETVSVLVGPDRTSIGRASPLALRSAPANFHVSRIFETWK